VTGEHPLGGHDGSGDKIPNARLRHGVVLKGAGPWSPSVHALLRHLENEGFTGAPTVVGSGFEDDGRETLSFLPGSSPHPEPWSDDAVAGIGRLLGGLHRAAATFRPPEGAVWQPLFSRDLAGAQPTFGHGDAGPWNIVALDGQPYAFIDWEFAGPIDALWELAEAVWLNAQLHDDDVAERWGLADAAGRGRQARLILDGYGLPAADRRGFLDRMIEFAIHAARAEAVTAHVTPESTAAIGADGYPVLWAVTWRARSASWMLRHRALLERALN
jgi:Ser/Thr protein kinase RdoA (MazF antagonist)